MGTSNLTQMQTQAEPTRGHFRAYGADGSVIFEKEDWTVGPDTVSYGISCAMVSSTIEDAKGNVIRQWKHGGYKW